MMNDYPKPPFPAQDLKQPGIEAEMDPRPCYEAPHYLPAGKLKGKIALITGGDSGIGRAVAFLYAKEGANIALIYLSEREDAKDIKSQIEQLGQEALLLEGNISDPEFCERAINDTVAKFGKIDILVNNAAYQKHRDNIEAVSIDQWNYTFNVNVHGYFYMSKFALKHMPEGSSIINTGSVTGLEGSKHLLDYAATNAAIHNFTKSLAQNLIDKKIRVNCVAPGPVWTPLNPAERSDEDIQDFGKDTPLGRPAQPEEIAPAYVFLASVADSSYITGLVLPILGGKTMAG